jgi:hypothetical protein
VLEQALRALSRLLCGSTNQSRDTASTATWIARVHTLRREGEIEVAARDEAGSFQLLPEEPVRCTGERGRLQDDEMPRP